VRVTPDALLKIRSGEKGNPPGKGRRPGPRREGFLGAPVHHHGGQFHRYLRSSHPGSPCRQGHEHSHGQDGCGGGTGAKILSCDAGAVFEMEDPVIEPTLEIRGNVDFGKSVKEASSFLEDGAVPSAPRTPGKVPFDPFGQRCLRSPIQELGSVFQIFRAVHLRSGILKKWLRPQGKPDDRATVLLLQAQKADGSPTPPFVSGSRGSDPPLPAGVIDLAQGFLLEGVFRCSPTQSQGKQETAESDAPKPGQEQEGHGRHHPGGRKPPGWLKTARPEKRAGTLLRPCYAIIEPESIHPPTPAPRPHPL